MELSVAVSLIEKAIDQIKDGQVWADLGAGNGLFTTALLNILPEGSTVYAVDKDRAVLQIKSEHKNKTLKTSVLDFVKENLQIVKLDGILMANSLHFVKDKSAFIEKISDIMKPDARIVVVEYDMDQPNRWVPFPMSYNGLRKFGEEAGLKVSEKLKRVPSVYQRAEIYSARLTRALK
jgi:ubiquinone/menaquinone biosynthesis C-methylase UbiE